MGSWGPQKGLPPESLSPYCSPHRHKLPCTHCGLTPGLVLELIVCLAVNSQWEPRLQL